jgi:hypothetical protein
MQNLMLGLLLTATPAPAPSVATAPAQLETVMVKGVQPGPRLWRVTRGDHTLWILGTLTPLPEQITWQSQEVDQIIAGAGVVLGTPRAAAKLGVGGMFKAATLAPSAIKSMKNADGQELRDVLPPALFARWTAAKRDYIGGDDRKIDKLKPSMAAIEFHGRAVSKAGLSGGRIGATVLESAKRHKVKVQPTGIEFVIDIDRKKFKGGIRAFAGMAPDIACFTETLDRIGPQLAQMQVRANAWARGDLDVLRQVALGDVQSPCQKIEKEALAWMQRPELEAEIAAAWVVSAREALDRHAVSFAALPIDKIVADPRYLGRLGALGYTVHEPDEPTPDDEDEDLAAGAGAGTH